MFANQQLRRKTDLGFPDVIENDPASSNPRLSNMYEPYNIQFLLLASLSGLDIMRPAVSGVLDIIGDQRRNWVLGMASHICFSMKNRNHVHRLAFTENIKGNSSPTEKVTSSGFISQYD